MVIERPSIGSGPRFITFVFLAQTYSNQMLVSCSVGARVERRRHSRVSGMIRWMIRCAVISGSRSNQGKKLTSPMNTAS